jgi:transcriptional regulator with XRE-family HTH domain
LQHIVINLLIMNTIGDFLRNLRINRGLKSVDMAANIDVSPSTYSHYENNQINLILPSFFRLAEFYNMHPADFLRLALKDSDLDFPYLITNEPDIEYKKSHEALKDELERRVKEIGVLEYRLSKYEPVNEIKAAGA